MILIQIGRLKVWYMIWIDIDIDRSRKKVVEMVYERELKQEIGRYQSRGWDDENIVKLLSHKYKIRKGDIEVIMMGDSNRRGDIQGWLRRKNEV